MATRHEVIKIDNEDDIVRVRQMARALSAEAEFSVVDETKIVTAASELARNIVVYAGRGLACMALVEEKGRIGLRIVFKDEGPGIEDLEAALKDGHTTGSGLGLGLGGARRLVNEFDILSFPGKGTTVSITRWK
jgi:serine/threonine-protein kinase RsbT